MIIEIRFNGQTERVKMSPADYANQSPERVKMSPADYADHADQSPERCIYAVGTATSVGKSVDKPEWNSTDFGFAFPSLNPQNSFPRSAWERKNGLVGFIDFALRGRGELRFARRTPLRSGSQRVSSHPPRSLAQRGNGSSGWTFQKMSPADYANHADHSPERCIHAAGTATSVGNSVDNPEWNSTGFGLPFPSRAWERVLLTPLVPLLCGGTESQAGRFNIATQTDH